MMPRILYAATGNPGKLREFTQHAGPDIQVLALPGFQNIAPCEETGETFEENARLKAAYYSRYCDGLVFADDSGIVIDALDGAPGVRSARYAGDDDANNAKVLEQLAGLPPERRTARFVCVIALAQHGQILRTFDGVAEGRIADSLHGSGGFGYDPLFFYPPLGCTFAEISSEEKWSRSHRGAAFRTMLSNLP